MKLLKPLQWRREALPVIAAVALMLSSLSASPVIHADEPAAASGLQGILPEYIPVGLYDDDFLMLGESWESWGAEVAEEVVKLYDPEQDVAAQRASIAVLKKKVGTMEKALADRAYRSIFDPVATIRSRLARRIEVADAILDTLEMNPQSAHKSRLDSARDEVVTAVDELDEYLGTIRNGKPWLKYVKADQVRGLTGGAVSMDVLTSVESKLSNTEQMENDAQREFVQRAQFVQLKDTIQSYIQLTSTKVAVPDQSKLRKSLTSMVHAIEAYEENRDAASARAAISSFKEVKEHAADRGDRIGGVLASHYFNYNLRIVASEKFLNKVVSYEHKDNSPVDDFILGAKIDGTQTTTGRVGLNLKPSDDTINFYMTFSGVTQSRTQGVTDQATIFTSGYHTFTASKTIGFDGDRFTTTPASVSVNASNTTTGARTGASGVPIFGGIADSIAVSAARDRKSQSEAIARQRVSSRVGPEFNEQVDAEFKGMTTSLSEKIIPKLHETNLFPSARSFRSSEDELWASQRLMGDAEFGGDSPTFTATSSDGIAIHFHETVMNNALDRLNLGGRSLTEAKLIKEIATGVGSIIGKKLKLPAKGEDGDKPDNTKFVFPKNDPIRVRIQDGELTLVIRAGLQPEEGDAIPTQEISVPLTFSLSDEDITIEAGAVGVAPVEPPASTFVQIARAGIVKSKLQKALPTRQAERVFKLERKTGGPVTLAVVQIKANAGWLSIVVE